jgi:haloalkane dehalogenase
VSSGRDPLPPDGILRTPEERFAGLPGFAFKPRYLDAGGARMHYLDEGRGQVLLLLHGEATWSYLYRKLIPELAWKHRVVAPDFVGFGRSDKHAGQEAYSFRGHVESLRALVERLDLKDITLVGQDSGLLVGLSLAAEEPSRFFRLAAVNVSLARDRTLAAACAAWWTARQAAAGVDPDLAAVLSSACPGLDPGCAAAYAAPYPDARYLAGVRTFPALGAPEAAPSPGDAQAGDEPPDLARARELLTAWFKPVLALFTSRDPATANARVADLLPAGGSPVVIDDAGHFPQEEKGEEVADRIHSFMLRTPPPRQTATFQPVPFW